MEIERIEDWVGQAVIDRDGEKVGKLQDVYFGTGTRDAVAAAVKTGVLGRKLNVVSLTGATVARDHVKIAFTRDQVKRAPQAEGGADLSPAQRDRLRDHFDMQLPSGPIESGNARADREREAREAAERAEELKKEAEERAREAREKQGSAEKAKRERDEALRRAEEARRAAE
jgi:sporulation protein YlmC with PRC-barrel domain